MPRKRVSNANSKRANSGLSLAINYEPILEALAAGQAFSESTKDKRYMDAVVDEAFELADDNFNVKAASYASTGAISHMYEWGTVGINKGRSSMRQDPMKPAARLWTNFSTGRGLNRTFWYAFRPSLSVVPKPTAAATGMSPTIINKMRDHVFKWKAEVMEEGQRVEINRRKAKFLLIPAYEQNRTYMRKSDIKRGYAVSKGPITTNPGASSFTGNFNTFWLGFWESEGNRIVDESVNSQILSDYEPEFRAPRTVKTLRPVGVFDARVQVKKRAKKIQTRVNQKAQARRVSR